MSQVYDEVLAMVGQEAEPRQGPDEVNGAMIRHWCEAMEDGNPLYSDEEYAKQSEYGGIIAPPQMVMSYCMAPIWPESKEEPDPFGKAVKIMKDAGYFGIVATTTSYEFFKPMLLGDRISIKKKLANISPEKKTRLGTGHFLTAEYIYTNQKGEPICVQSFTVLTFKPEA
jgi:acyl dehydratase